MSDQLTNEQLAKCFAQKTYWDDEARHLRYVRECFVKDPACPVLE